MHPCCFCFKPLSVESSDSLELVVTAESRARPNFVVDSRDRRLPNSAGSARTCCDERCDGDGDHKSADHLDDGVVVAPACDEIEDLDHSGHQEQTSDHVVSRAVADIPPGRCAVSHFGSVAHAR